jgi:hypothetical protein
MVDLTEIQAAYYMVAATGVIVAAVFYILNLQTQKKNMKINQETRQIQLLLEYNQAIASETFPNIKTYRKIVNAKWDSFDDFVATGYRDPEVSSFREVLFRRYHVTGLMIRDGLISIDTFVEYLHDAPVMVWEKYRPIVYEFRKRYHLPTYLEGFEYLAEEINRYRVRKGWGVKTPDEIVWPYLKEAS